MLLLNFMPIMTLETNWAGRLNDKIFLSSWFELVNWLSFHGFQSFEDYGLALFVYIGS